jgi:hypothetical protein
MKVQNLISVNVTVKREREKMTLRTRTRTTDTVFLWLYGFRSFDIVSDFVLRISNLIIERGSPPFLRVLGPALLMEPHSPLPGSILFRFLTKNIDVFRGRKVARYFTSGPSPGRRRKAFPKNFLASDRLPSMIKRFPMPRRFRLRAAAVMRRSRKLKSGERKRLVYTSPKAP